MARESWTVRTFQVIDDNGVMRSGYFPIEDTATGNVQVDYVWGNIPMQPDTDRDGGTHTIEAEDGGNWSDIVQITSDTLQDYDYVVNLNGLVSAVPADSHINATRAYEGFPEFLQGNPFDDTIANVTVPDVSGVDAVTAEGILNDAGLFLGDTTNVQDGATGENNGLVLAQTPAADSQANAGSYVDISVYSVPTVTVPNVVGMSWIDAHAALEAVGLGWTESYSSVGGSESNVNTTKSSTPGAGQQAPVGSAVALVYYEFIGYSIAGLRYDATIDSNNGGYYLFYQGRLNQPSIDDLIYVWGSGQDIDGAHTVLDVIDDDAFNTGGTKVVLNLGSSTYTGAQIIGQGLWAHNDLS